MGLLGILIGILILSLMMIVHELGHFLAGKALGFKIISYNIFMGPILFKRTGKDGILYTIRLFPIGASVEFAGEGGQLEGQEDIDPEDSGLFYNRPRWARAIVIFMGPFINFVTAFLAFVILFTSFGVTVPVVGKVLQDSPAAAAGLEEGDRLINLNGTPIHSALDLSVAELFGQKDKQLFTVKEPDGTLKQIDIPQRFENRYYFGITYTPREDKRIVIQSVSDGEEALKPGDELLSINGVSVKEPEAFVAKDPEAQSVKVKVIRDGKELDLDKKVTVRHAKVEDGFYLRANEGVGEALEQSVVYPWSIVRSSIVGLGKIATGALNAKDGLAGPVGIVVMVGDVVGEKAAIADKVNRLLMLFGIISVAVGFTNLLPIPPFDGFHLLILAIEGVRRKDLSLKLKERIAAVGFMIIIALAVLVFYLDIARLFSR